MRGRLQIGAVAQLLGITTKTVRHYHKLGLLREPDRTAAGYRLYDAADLLRLHQIRRLQALGLPLAQIRAILGTPGDATALGGVLRALRADVERQIALLTARREEIDRLIADDPDRALVAPQPTPAALAQIEETLAAHLPGASAALRQQEERSWAVLEAFDWPTEYVTGWRKIAEYYAAHPEALRALHDLSERVLALADRAPDDPTIAALADDFHRYQREHPPPPDLLAGVTDHIQPFGHVFGALLSTDLTPAQRQFMALLNDTTGEP